MSDDTKRVETGDTPYLVGMESVYRNVNFLNEIIIQGVERIQDGLSYAYKLDGIGPCKGQEFARRYLEQKGIGFQRAWVQSYYPKTGKMRIAHD